MATLLNLEAKRLDVRQDAGTDINIRFTFSALNTTGYTWEYRIYAADPTHTAPSGDAIDTLTSGDGITHTPGTNSIVAVTIGTSINTLSRAGEFLWGELWRTDSGNTRKYAKGWIELRP